MRAREIPWFQIHHVANARIDSVRSWDSRGQPKGSNKCEGHRRAWLCLPRGPGKYHTTTRVSEPIKIFRISADSPLSSRNRPTNFHNSIAISRVHWIIARCRKLRFSKNTSEKILLALSLVPLKHGEQSVL